MRGLAVIGLVAGCAHHATPPPQQVVHMDPMVFAARPDGGVELIDAASLFDRAGAAFGAKQFAEAAALYDRIVREYPESRYLVPSLYNAGLSLEGTGDLGGAVERYRKITIEHADAGDALDAWYRLGHVQDEAKNFAAAAETYAQILARKDLSLADRVEAMARRGVAQFMKKDIIAAEHTLREELAYYRAHETDERIDNDYFLGMGAFYLGECAHEQYRALPVRLPEKRMARDLEAKARQLLVAQARFLDAMRVNNAEWATAAGFRIGSLYHEFYDALVGAPIPPALNGEEREVYLDEVKKQVRTLLEKAVSIHEKNVLMAERVGERNNDWVKRSNEELEQLKKLLTPGPLPAERASPTPPPAPPPLPRPRDEVRPHVVM